MNTYEIEGIKYEAKNEYEAVKQAYKMADHIILISYIGNETWDYAAMFRSGKSNVTVKRIRKGGCNMKTIATIRANDEISGAVIELGYIAFTDDEENDGFQVVASNGDDVGYFRAQTAEKCKQDIYAMWSHWDTFEEV